MPFEHKLIDLSNKPDDFLDKYQLATGNRRGLVPLLEFGEDDLVVESDVVAKYVAQNIQGVGGKGDELYPKTKEDEKLIDSFLSKWSRVTDTYYSVLTATSQKQVDQNIQSFLSSLKTIDDIFKNQQRSDDENFLLGGTFTYAECISAPWIQRFYVTMPYFRGIDFEKDLLLNNNFECLSNGMGAVCQRQSCIDSKCPEDEMIAACKRYYVSYLSPGASGSL